MAASSKQIATLLQKLDFTEIETQNGAAARVVSLALELPSKERTEHLVKLLSSDATAVVSAASAAVVASTMELDEATAMLLSALERGAQHSTGKCDAILHTLVQSVVKIYIAKLLKEQGAESTNSTPFGVLLDIDPALGSSLLNALCSAILAEQSMTIAVHLWSNMMSLVLLRPQQHSLRHAALTKAGVHIYRAKTSNADSWAHTSKLRYVYAGEYHRKPASIPEARCPAVSFVGTA